MSPTPSQATRIMITSVVLAVVSLAWTVFVGLALAGVIR